MEPYRSKRAGGTSMTITLIAVFVLGWLLAATIGTWAYFANDQPNVKHSGSETGSN